MCFVVSTYFGRENEISGFTWFDGLGREFDQNHWMMVVHTPGSCVYDVPPPAEGMTECPPVCRDTCIADSDQQTSEDDNQADQAAGTPC